VRIGRLRRSIRGRESKERMEMRGKGKYGI
jgi:hypothetical protein